MKETIYTRFVYAILRHLISAACGILVAKGWVEAETANAFTDSAAMQITLGLVSFAMVLYMSYKDKVWEFVKTNIAKVLPPTTPMDTVVDVAKNVQNKKEVAKGDLSSLDLTGVPNA